MFRYLLQQRSDTNIVFMTHLGDITERGTEQELSLAGKTFRENDGRVSYSVLAGNHDMPGGNDRRGRTPYLNVFGPGRFSRMPTFLEATADGYNSAHLLRAGGRQWLILALDWRISDPGLAWVQKVIDQHPQIPVILTTHGLAYADDADQEPRFIKLPEPFTGDHAWLGILSWEDRSGDAGKKSGYSPLEPTCSLNLSPERFLQYVVYSEIGDINPTSWSHTIPVGRWTHVAIVNDGRQSVVWVDGSRIARNPAREARGIATLGRPFTIGATSWDLKYGQGFYG